MNTLLSVRWFAVWRRNALVWRRLAGPALLGNIGEPLLYLLALGYGLGALVGDVGGLDYIAFLASGFVAASAMNTASFEGLYSAYTRMAVQETWTSMLVTPLGVADVVVGETVWAASKALLSAAAILLVASALDAVEGVRSLLVLPVVFLSGLCFAAMALVITAVSRSYDFFLYYFTLLMTPMLLLSGVFFPLEGMPALVQTGALALPLAHIIAIVRPLMTGGPVTDLLFHLAIPALYATFGLIVAVRLIRRRLLH